MISENSQRENGGCQEVAAAVSTTRDFGQEMSLVLKSGHDVPEDRIEQNTQESKLELRRHIDVVGEVVEKVSQLVQLHDELVLLSDFVVLFGDRQVATFSVPNRLCIYSGVSCM